MRTLLSLGAVALGLAAAPAMASDCTTAAGLKTSETNETVVREMLAYAYEQAAPVAGQTDCRTEAVATGPRPLPDQVACVDCPDGQTGKTAA